MCAIRHQVSRLKIKNEAQVVGRSKPAAARRRFRRRVCFNRITRPIASPNFFPILANFSDQSIDFMRQSTRAMLSASVFLFVACTAARTSECDQPAPAVARKAAQPRQARPVEMRLAARGSFRAPSREATLGSPSRPACASLGCPGAIVLGIGY